MATLAFKALAYGADKIPDKFFEALPGGYYRRKEEKELKRRKKDQNLRSQSEGRARRRRSPSYSDEDEDYYSSDYYTSGEEFGHEQRRRRKDRRSDSSDEKDHRGRERERRRSHIGRLRSYDSHHMPPPLPPYGQPQPPISAADEVYAQPQPHNPAAYAQAKPYNPAEYGLGQLNLPLNHAASNFPSHVPSKYDATFSGTDYSSIGATEWCWLLWNEFSASSTWFAFISRFLCRISRHEPALHTSQQPSIHARKNSNSKCAWLAIQLCPSTRQYSTILSSHASLHATKQLSLSSKLQPVSAASLIIRFPPLLHPQRHQRQRPRRPGPQHARQKRVSPPPLHRRQLGPTFPLSISPSLLAHRRLVNHRLAPGLARTFSQPHRCRRAH
ncbi:hypothetical protein JOL62DRAFT_49445 [Phyllosticta paracitricarpa]|uniref:Uncharacterized protein n=1 Tax=Phyllosticta paracitricarpa TaxID=2016321 RepID=A0ABR1NCS3_9PEZI